MKVVFIRSRKRRRTVSGRVKNDILEVRIPLWMPQFQAGGIAQEFEKKIRKKSTRISDTFLQKRAQFLIRKYLGREIKNFSINWSKRQTKIFGICQQRKREIRISNRLAKAPLYVLDYLIIHETAHLLEPNHSKKFWQIVRRYPKVEKAKGFLEGLVFDRG